MSSICLFFYLSILPTVLICFKTSLAECDMLRNISPTNKDILASSFPVWHPLSLLLLPCCSQYFGTILSKSGKHWYLVFFLFLMEMIWVFLFGIALTKHLLFVIPNAFAYMCMYVCGYMRVDTQMYSCICMWRLEVDVECLP